MGGLRGIGTVGPLDSHECCQFQDVNSPWASSVFVEGCSKEVYSLFPIKPLELCDVFIDFMVDWKFALPPMFLWKKEM